MEVYSYILGTTGTPPQTYRYCSVPRDTTDMVYQTQCQSIVSSASSMIMDMT